jgi:hypothetical protein
MNQYVLFITFGGTSINATHYLYKDDVSLCMKNSEFNVIFNAQKKQSGNDSILKDENAILHIACRKKNTDAFIYLGKTTKFRRIVQERNKETIQPLVIHLKVLFAQTAQVVEHSPRPVYEGIGKHKLAIFHQINMKPMKLNWPSVGIVKVGQK